MRFVLVLLAIVATIVPCTAAEINAPAAGHGYRLAPGDRINVTVHGQPELSGDFLIDGAGEIHIPLLNALKVDQSTIDDAREALVDRLSTGLLKNPSVSIRVSEFRPVYVLGDVRAPGSYPFRFGLSGLSAIALAGGIGRPDLTAGGAVTDVVAAEERVKVLIKSRLGLLVRLARLETERNGQEAFEYSPTGGTANDEDASDLVNEEREQMRVLQQAHARTIALLDRQRPQVQAEIETTKEQITVENSQLRLIRSRLSQYNNLVKQGLGRSVTELDFQRQAADREGIISRLKGDLARLETKLGDLDIRAQDVENARQIRIASDLREVKLKLRELDVQLPSARELLELRHLQSGATARGERLGRTLTLTRAGVRRQLSPQGEGTALEPGDIVEVKADMPRATLDNHTSALSPKTKTKAASLSETSNGATDPK